jgi:8-oxo-dGTP diphosphatase
MSRYEGSRVGVDAVIFSVAEGALQVLVHRREKAPFEGQLELPGGLLMPRESAEQALQRKIQETAPDASRAFFEQFKTFTDPDRDPRERTISIAYFALVPAVAPASGTEWRPVEALRRMAFDHLTIVKEARAYLKERATLPLLRHLLPEHFRLNEAQKLLELLTERSMDNRNFRRWALATGYIEDTGRVLSNVSHRPAALFKLRATPR